MSTSWRPTNSPRPGGPPVARFWDQRINFADVWRNEDMTFEQRRDAIVLRLRRSRWLAGRDEGDWLLEVVANLADAEGADEFDGWWDELYDVADIDRVWIKLY